MNILYIIGNGFDLAQGLKTRYADFYPYYQKCPSPNEAAKLMKKEINEHAGDWSDMEIALGKFTKQVGSEEDLGDMYFDLCDRLTEYLTKEFEKTNSIKNDKIIEDLCQPFKYLETLDERIYADYVHRAQQNGQVTGNINIVSLNYTNTLEQLSNYTPNGSYVFASGKYKIGSVCHLHGVLGDTILLGVNDELQIDNDLFKSNPAVRDYLIKKEAIASMRSDNEFLCENYIKKADVIILYGVSLGATDKYLWDKIVNRMKRGDMPLLVYFQYSDDVIPNNRRQRLGRKIADARNFLYSRMGITENLQIENQILIGYNKDIFKIKDDKNTSQSGKIEN